MHLLEEGRVVNVVKGLRKVKKGYLGRLFEADGKVTDSKPEKNDFLNISLTSEISVERDSRY